MGESTKIQWTDRTFNPWWGCTKVSPGCDHCYAESLDKRLGGSHWGQGSPRREFGDKHWGEPLKWDREAGEAGVRSRVFCASMADVFDAEVPQAWRDRLWALIHETPALDWQILTKRPNLINKLGIGGTWPANVWLGTSIESHEQIWRIDELRKVDAAVRFLSLEPLIGPVGGSFSGIDWVIIGGESGGGAREFDILWARDVIIKCRQSGTAVFVKQLGAKPVLDGAKVMLRDHKGGDIEEFPADLRIREFPEALKSQRVGAYR